MAAPKRFNKDKRQIDDGDAGRCVTQALNLNHGGGQLECVHPF